ncbi:MAG: hypothetical protein ABIQ41_00120 [Gemmatimonadales bacterium]
MSWTIGTDIEVFGKRKDGHHVSLCGLIGGSKEKPRQLKHLSTGFMVQEDNVSLEYNIPACSTERAFVESIKVMRRECSNILGGLNLEVSENASFYFIPGELTHPNALIFGCEPDYNAWTKMENPRPDGEDKALRTCGGHVHVGISKIDMVNGVKAMDLFLGVPSILLDDSLSSAKRRERYGKAGAMRPKPYGWEYRVLSNFWTFSDFLVSWVYKNTKESLSFDTKKLTKQDGELIQTCINTGDKALAKTIMDKFNVPLPTVYKEPKRASTFDTDIGSEWGVQKFILQDTFAMPIGGIGGITATNTGNWNYTTTNGT